MMLRSLGVVTALAGLWMARPPAAAAAAADLAEPGRLGVAAEQPALDPSGNQTIADAVANRLRQSGTLHHYDIHIRCQNGIIELRGQVGNPAQRDEVLRAVQGVPGVVRVDDQLKVAGSSPVAQVQVVMPPAMEPQPLPPQASTGVAPSGRPAEPMPIYQASGVLPGAANQPPLPPYAWPTYAAYNNYSRVAYPTLYPYQAWPFIGPIYPFPKIPPGWRSIKLEWYDGYWWYGKVANPHDWWRIRYW